jgi:hypothetical protein
MSISQNIRRVLFTSRVGYENRVKKNQKFIAKSKKKSDNIYGIILSGCLKKLNPKY